MRVCTCDTHGYCWACAEVDADGRRAVPEVYVISSDGVPHPGDEREPEPRDPGIFD